MSDLTRKDLARALRAFAEAWDRDANKNVATFYALRDAATALEESSVAPQAAASAPCGITTDAAPPVAGTGEHMLTDAELGSAILTAYEAAPALKARAAGRRARELCRRELPSHIAIADAVLSVCRMARSDAGEIARAVLALMEGTKR